MEKKYTGHIRLVSSLGLQKNVAERGCGECQTSCQSACKTSCTVANQVCQNENK